MYCVLSAFKRLSRVMDRHLGESLSYPKCKMDETQDSRKRRDIVDSSCGNGIEKWDALEMIRNLNLSCTLGFPTVNFL